MKLINLNSKKGFVNLFADYILNQFDVNSNTIIQVTDFNHFIAVNGITDSDKFIDLKKIKDEFVSEYLPVVQNLGYDENLNTLDLIKYNKKITESKNRFLWSTFYDSSRPIYHDEVIKQHNSEKEFYSVDYDNGLKYELNYDSVIFPSKFVVLPLQVSSEFPHGHSLSMDRLLLYYSEYISYQIIKTCMCKKLDLYITTQKNQDGDQTIDLIAESPVSKEKIKSLILDLFSFDFNEFKEKIKGYNFCHDILLPISDKPWLIKDKNFKDLMVF